MERSMASKSPWFRTSTKGWHHSNRENMKVADLIDYDNKMLRVDEVQNMFDEESHTAILRTQFDRVIWNPSGNGNFSVKSAYMFCGMETGLEIEDSRWI